RASEIYGEILAADSTETRALFQLGVALERQGRFEESLDVFRRLVKLDPDHDGALNYMGYMCIERGVHIKEAMSWVERALDEEPEAPAYLDSLGWGYFQLGRYEDAARWLRKAVENGGRQPEILLHLAAALERLGEPGEAARLARQVLAGDPENAEARRILEGLAEPGGDDR
ncbi:MAG: tetratricopeptide repeat protein, partial [Candidatus Eisenbacteria bacterium]|nr:tetratricopeptide repeat protein [Candidatus Eisenbacteria bacterium]